MVVDTKSFMCGSGISVGSANYCNWCSNDHHTFRQCLTPKASPSPCNIPTCAQLVSAIGKVCHLIHNIFPHAWRANCFFTLFCERDKYRLKKQFFVMSLQEPNFYFWNLNRFEQFFLTCIDTAFGHLWTSQWVGIPVPMSSKYYVITHTSQNPPLLDWITSVPTSPPRLGSI
jgi:hypothetical protein